MCGCCIFTRGAQSLACVLSTMRLLDAETNLRWARAESLALAERPLAELLAPRGAAAPLARPAAPVADERLAAGGAR
jgi:hypothetical protein